ncbi:hypothetical protein [Gloeothece verrucosa]|uniref:Uncharacterized protein n=1 Tax=Gloeothece verrucosa (strain PCC 7822) TaxID=497965 RepID=E0U6Y3_GLOV7|nr:hypothetical protein [Gloeothece verrucosa]ADN16020.1 hypothetical protein Cyan7822_4100 [Gloeothece verrucosa PCC 7822]
MAKFVIWKLTQDNRDYYFQAPENHYNGSLSPGITGVTLATEEEKAKYPIIPVANLLKSPVANRVNLSIRIGTGATAKRRSLKFLIPVWKLPSVEAVKSGNYTTADGQSATILGIYKPLKRGYKS